MKGRISALVLASIALAGCEPLRGVVSEGDFSSSADLDCIDQTLRGAFDQVERWDYRSDGGTFPGGTQVAQFAYYSSADKAGWATLHVAAVDAGTRVEHRFTGIGSELPQEHFPPAFDAMRKASEAVRAACGIDLSGMQLRAVGQKVDALD